MKRITIKKPRRSDSGKAKPLYGKPTSDAAQMFLFDINRRDCERGAKNDHEKCAAAVALCRQVPHVVAVHVGRSYTIVEYVDRCVRFRTSGALRDQTIRYDASRQFEPGAYKLMPVPACAIRARGRRQGGTPKYKQARYNPEREPRAPQRVVGRPSLLHKQP
jgi:hypothetical protein